MIKRSYFLAVVLLLTIGLSTSWAQYTSSASVTAGAAADYCDVSAGSVSFSIVEDTAAVEDLGMVYNITSIADAYDNKLAITIYLMNPHELTARYSYFILNVTAMYYSNGTGSSSTLTVDEWALLTLDKGYITLYPDTDLSSLPGFSGDKGFYEIHMELRYYCFDASGSIPGPEFYIEVKQAGAA